MVVRVSWTFVWKHALEIYYFH